jgi:hypothetical protein
MSSAAVAAKLASLQLDGFEKRKQFGKLGKKVKIMTNMFEITKLPQTVIMQYAPPSPFLVSSTSIRCFLGSDG